MALDSMILGESQIPVLKELRDRLERVRAAELERALRRLRHLSPDDGAQLEQFSHTLLNKFLHQPTIALKEAARAGREYGLVEALKRLFGLGLLAAGDRVISREVNTCACGADDEHAH